MPQPAVQIQNPKKPDEQKAKSNEPADPGIEAIPCREGLVQPTSALPRRARQSLPLDLAQLLPAKVKLQTSTACDH